MFPTRLLTSEDEYKWYWHQMIYFPETINTVSTTNTMSPLHSPVSPQAMHINLLCASWHLEAMKGSSLTSCRLLILSRLSSSFVWAQLTLLVLTLGIRPPFSQDGVPIHWVRAHSLTGIRNSRSRRNNTRVWRWPVAQSHSGWTGDWKSEEIWGLIG